MTPATDVRPWLPAEIRRAGERVVVHDLYDEPGSAVYHDVAGRDTHEIREILAALRQHPGDVLDLAAGSGRLTFPVLATGRRVTALELSAGMLAILADRLSAAPAAVRDRCSVVRGDMTDFAVDRRFGVVLLGTTSISLLDGDGRRALYERVRRHLDPSGVFLVSTVDVRPGSGEASPIRFEVTGSSGRRYRLFEHHAPGAAVRSVVIVPAPPAGGEVHAFTSSIGVLPADRLADELAAAGLRVEARRELPGLSGRHVGTLLTVSAVG